MKNIFKHTFIEFIELISGYNQIKEYTISLDYRDEITGTIEDFEKMSANLTTVNNDSKRNIFELNKLIYDIKKEASHSYNMVEIKKYFKKLTNNYNKEDLKIVIFDMDVFDNMELDEVMRATATRKYLENKWEIPIMKLYNHIDKKEEEFADYKKMKAKVFQFHTDDFYWIKKFLETKLQTLEEPTEQIKTNKISIDNPHSNIFKDNAFEIWQSMFDCFNITKSKRTDIDFMFEVMKYHKLIYENIGYIDIQNWINTVYEISFDKIKYTDHKVQSNEKRLAIYNTITSK